VAHPQLGVTPHYDEGIEVRERQVKMGRLADPKFFRAPPPSTASHEEVTMRPGDVLYHPAGIWHKVSTIEPGVSINVSLMAASYAEVVAAGVRHVLEGKEEYRQRVVDIPGGGGGGGALDELGRLLRGLPDAIRCLTEAGGEGALLPDVMRFPHPIDFDEDDGDDDDGGDDDDDVMVAMTSDGDDDDEDDEDDDGDDNDDDDDDDNTEDGGMGGKSDEEDSEKSDGVSEGGKQEDDDDGVDSIDMQLFTGPPGWNPPAPRPSARLLKNPLASLVSSDDLAADPPLTGHSISSARYYVLNVNFAGNESFESSVRRVLTGWGPLEILCRAERQMCDPVQALPKTLMDEWKELLPGGPLGALLFYGYFYWTSLDGGGTNNSNREVVSLSPSSSSLP